MCPWSATVWKATGTPGLSSSSKCPSFEATTRAFTSPMFQRAEQSSAEPSMTPQSGRTGTAFHSLLSAVTNLHSEGKGNFSFERVAAATIHGIFALRNSTAATFPNPSGISSRVEYRPLDFLYPLEASHAAPTAAFLSSFWTFFQPAMSTPPASLNACDFPFSPNIAISPTSPRSEVSRALRT